MELQKNQWKGDRQQADRRQATRNYWWYQGKLQRQMESTDMQKPKEKGKLLQIKGWQEL